MKASAKSWNVLGILVELMETKCKKYIAMKELTKAMKDKNRIDFPDVETVKYKCHGNKNHSETCGCIRPGHINAAKRNLYCIMVQSETPEEFQRR